MFKLNWVLYRIFDKLAGAKPAEGRRSYAQCGEDLILRFVFDSLRIPMPTYLDIGAHDPHKLSNTYLFYEGGSSGVNVEPDPALYSGLESARPRDVNLNIGIGETEDVLKLHVMSTRTLNTFSDKEANRLIEQGFAVESVLDIKVLTVNDILNKYFKEAAPDFVSIDVEGLDIQILRSFDFARWRPKAFCVETITFSSNRDGKKIPEIAEILCAHGYFPFADTYVNTIFVDRQAWLGSGS